jgi:hypothetical protein
MNPRTVQPAVVPECRSTGPARQASVSGLRPCRGSRTTAGGFSTAAAGKLPWGSPFQGIPQRPWSNSRPTSSPALCQHRRSNIGRRPRVSIDPRLSPPAPPGRSRTKVGQTTLIGFPHRPDPEHSSAPSPGLWVHLAPRRASLPTAWRSLDERNALPELSGFG